MATLQQEAAVDKLVEQGGKSISRAMRESRLPYSPKTAKTPKKLTESKGFREILTRRGLTEDFITRALVNDIKNKPKNRIAELKLGAEILGMKAVQGTGENKTLIINVTGETAARYGITASNPEAGSE